MEPGEAARRVLEGADAPLHWTAVFDRALRAGYIDPFTQPNARDELMRWLARAAQSGEIERTSTGTYRVGPSSPPEDE